MTSHRAPALLLTVAGLALTAQACAADADGAGGESADRGTTFRAGDYSAEGTYRTPAGEERIGVDLTLDADGTITDLVVTSLAVQPNSQQFQAKFISGIDEIAVGKSISELSVDKVAGSSLSSGGFNAALDEIARQAGA